MSRRRSEQLLREYVKVLLEAERSSDAAFNILGEYYHTPRGHDENRHVVVVQSSYGPQAFYRSSGTGGTEETEGMYLPFGGLKITKDGSERPDAWLIKMSPEGHPEAGRAGKELTTKAPRAGGEFDKISKFLSATYGANATSGVTAQQVMSRYLEPTPHQKFLTRVYHYSALNKFLQAHGALNDMGHGEEFPRWGIHPATATATGRELWYVGEYPIVATADPVDLLGSADGTVPPSYRNRDGSIPGPSEAAPSATPAAEPAAAATPASKPAAKPPSTRRRAAAASGADTGDVLRLTGPGGDSADLRLTTRLQQSSVRRFGAAARFWDNNWQATLQKRSDGWYVVPNGGAPNDTLLNGKKIVSGKKLRAGDELAVGRAAKGIVKLPLTVSFETSR